MGLVILWGKMEASRVTETSANHPRKVWTESWEAWEREGPQGRNGAAEPGARVRSASRPEGSSLLSIPAPPLHLQPHPLR